jgi:hypothetical protein
MHGGEAGRAGGLCAELVAFAQTYMREHPAPRQRKGKRAQIDGQMLADMLSCVQVPPHQVRAGK